MSKKQECLTYPDLVSRLDGTCGPVTFASVQQHLSSCSRCMAALRVMQELIREEATPEETVVLDRFEPGLTASTLRVVRLSRN